MTVSKSDFLKVVNDVMARMFYLLPDVDDHGHQKLTGSIVGESTTAVLEVNSDTTLMFVFQQELMELMTANITALPVNEVPLDWIRQIPIEAAGACWGQYLTVYDKQSKFALATPYIPDEPSSPEKYQWHFTYQSESCRLEISLR